MLENHRVKYNINAITNLSQPIKVTQIAEEKASSAITKLLFHERGLRLVIIYPDKFRERCAGTRHFGLEPDFNDLAISVGGSPEIALLALIAGSQAMTSSRGEPVGLLFMRQRACCGEL